ncbi:hypothetical protein QIT80_gp55 (endogenous virus) [Pseudomonas phage phiAH14a]|uniref:Uncharacterized protein n=1 Tax=Pseudomonas phage phiAH14a TaxID=1805958 RepID=A0A1B0VMF0_9CAUD|nr:hypothetical protein QIT80_gp55 [Pseudomonas phage phiAH14a]AMW64515.1 hypothetical protein AH14a_p55 [Pseudomonas phage phiAH14a]
MNRSAPAALPAQSEGCGGAENKKAPINVEALNRCACLPTLPAKDLPGVDTQVHRSRCSCLAPPWKHSEVRARGLPVFFRSAALPAYQRPGLPRAALAAGKSTDSSCGCASPWLHQDVGIRQFVGYARSRSHQPGVLPPPKPFWRAPADCLWLSASRTPPEGWIQGNKNPAQWPVSF